MASQPTIEEFCDLHLHHNKKAFDELKRKEYFLRCFLMQCTGDNKLERRKLLVPRSSGALELHDVSMTVRLIRRFPVVDFGLMAHMIVGNNDYMTKEVSLKELLFYNGIEPFNLPDTFDFEMFNLEVLDASQLFE